MGMLMRSVRWGGGQRGLLMGVAAGDGADVSCGPAPRRPTAGQRMSLLGAASDPGVPDGSEPSLAPGHNTSKFGRL